MQLMDFVFVRGPFGPGDGGGAGGLHWLISDRAKVPDVLIIVDKEVDSSSSAKTSTNNNGAVQVESSSITETSDTNNGVPVQVD